MNERVRSSSRAYLKTTHGVGASSKSPAGKEVVGAASLPGAGGGGGGALRR